jgi:hypothetical protein
MPDSTWQRPITPKREAIEGICVDCGKSTPAAQVARVLRKAAADGNARIVCMDCSARKHATKQPTPLTVQRAPRRHPMPDEESR